MQNNAFTVTATIWLSVWAQDEEMADWEMIHGAAHKGRWIQNYEFLNFS